MPKRTIKDYPQVSLKQDDLCGAINFEDIFGRSAPVHIEIGSGKGTFLVNQARHQPEINFLGIEWANKYYRAAVDRIGRWQIKNIRLIRTDAAEFLAEFISPASIECFHIYFPDPWPKKRHNKRRFFSTSNLAVVLRCLKPNGTIQLATDHKDYFQQANEVIEKELLNGSIEIVDFIRSADATETEAVGTNYERKYIKEGRAVYTVAIKKL